jgi:hypothetical protein
VPPLPPGASAATPAALTGGGRGPLDPNRSSPRIGADGDTGSPTWQGTGKATAPPVALEQPQPLSGAAVPIQPGPAPTGQPTANVTPTSFEQLQAQLAQRGVSYQRLVASENGEWAFTCARPMPQKPTLRQVYEKKAGDPLTAIRAVLDAIDQDH